LLEFIQAGYPVPCEFASKAYYYIKAFNHNFGTYHELVVIYDDLYLSTVKESELESDNDYLTSSGTGSIQWNLLIWNRKSSLIKFE
jgi:hypothetical protein